MRTTLARRQEAGRDNLNRTRVRGRVEPLLGAGRGEQPPLSPHASRAVEAPPEAPAVTLFPAQEPARSEAAAAPEIVVAAAPAAAAAAPEICLTPRAGTGAAIPPVAPEATAPACPVDPWVRRITLSAVASILLHGVAAAAFVWLSWRAPLPASAGEEGIPVELVIAADTGSASQQDVASGRDEDVQTDASASQAAHKVDAPPAETPPEPAAAEPVETPSEEPPVAQPDPMTTAERILDQLPPPPMPDSLPIIDKPVEPAPVEASPQPPVEQPPPPQPVQETPPAPTPEPAQKVETEAPTEVQAAVPQAVTEPPPTPAVTPPPQPAAVPVRRQATRPPPTRREAPTTRERTRPTRQVAATPQPERLARAARQAESHASRAERGDGTGQRNRQRSDATGTSGASTAAAVASYRQRVLAHLARFKVYPEQARDRGIRGRTGITFTLSASGSVSSVAVTSSSGAPLLDRETLAMVRRAQPFPPNPAGGSASFSAGINYSLH